MSKIIHYCWFGDKPLPSLAKKCIKSWKKYLPGYEIMCWSEKNFDVNSTKFSKDAYENKKWAFVSDVARIYALKEYGGIYMDTDMMITKDVSEIIKSEFFVGWESELNVAVGVLGVKEKHHPVIEELYDFYSRTSLNMTDLFSQSIPRLLSTILRRKYNLQSDHLHNQYLEDGIVVYARDYFYPISSDNSPDMFTENTCMIHYYTGSWLPRSQRIRNRVHELLGERFGDVFLDWAVSLKRTARMTGRLVLFPFVKRRRDRIMERNSSQEIANYGELFDKAGESDYMAFYNPNWLGTSIATKELFEHTLPLEELAEQNTIDYIADRIIAKGYKLIIFSAFAFGWQKLITAVHEKDPDITIKVIWHGSNCMNIEAYDWEVFQYIFRLLNKKYIYSIGFVKKSMYEFYKKKGYNVEFVMNTLSLDSSEYMQDEKSEETRTIGVYASGDRWVKNFYNQLCAASLMDNIKVECTPLSTKTMLFADIIHLEVEGEGKPMPRKELLKKMSKNLLNLYVTFTECAPLIPLESLELGVPCLTGNNHHYWEGTELADYLIVDEADDVNRIYEKMELCAANRDKIIKLYREWKKQYDIEAKESVEKFKTLGVLK